MTLYEASFPSQDYWPRIKDNFCIIVVGVVIHENRVLLIQEAKDSCYGKYFLPAGRLEPHETLIDGVKREVREEAGLAFEPRRLVLLEANGSSWLSITFLGDVVGGKLKAVPDTESLQARWFDMADVKRMESEWFSVHRTHRLGRPPVGGGKPDTVQLRAPVLHMINAALQFHSDCATSIATVPLPGAKLDGLQFILFRLAVVWADSIRGESDTRPSHLLVLRSNSDRLPAFRINHINPPRAITLALKTMLSTAQFYPTWDTKRVSILDMTFVPRPPNDLLKEPNSDGFLLALRIAVKCDTSCDTAPPTTAPGFHWIHLQENCDLPIAYDGIPSSLIQLPLDTRALPFYRL